MYSGTNKSFARAPSRNPERARACTVLQHAQTRATTAETAQQCDKNEGAVASAVVGGKWSHLESGKGDVEKLHPALLAHALFFRAKTDVQLKHVAHDIAHHCTQSVLPYMLSSPATCSSLRDSGLNTFSTSLSVSFTPRVSVGLSLLKSGFHGFMEACLLGVDTEWPNCRKNPKSPNRVSFPPPLGLSLLIFLARSITYEYIILCVVRLLPFCLRALS